MKMIYKNSYRVMCFLISVFFSFISISKSFAVPAYDGIIEVRQPSGLSFEGKLFGDEWYNWVETKDGYGIHKNPDTANWEYYLPAVDDLSKTIFITNPVVGEVDPFSLGIPKGLKPDRTSEQFVYESALRHLKKVLSGDLERAPVSGTKYLLVIGVDYSDRPATYTTSQIQPQFFGSTNSVSNYFSNASYSTVTVSPTTETHETYNDGFVGWLRLSGNHPNTGDAITIANQQISKDAIIAADPYIDYSSYDFDGNGVISPTELSIIIIVAGYEAAAGGPSPSIWAHKGYMSGVGYPSVDGKTIQEYAQFGEIQSDHLATFGVMAHELGHLMFSLPDLYDTDTSNGDSHGIGYFDLMGAGSWGAASGSYAGSSPTLLSAWCREYLSWGTVNTISSNQTVSFPKTDGNTSSIFRINTSDSNQYFLMENRQFSGYDSGFQRSTGVSGHGGLVIYHIDKLKTNLWPASNTVNAKETDKGVDVEEANEGSLGYSMLDTNASAGNTNMFFFSGNNSSFTNSTTPSSKLKNGTSTNISITDISVYGDTMTAAVELNAIVPNPQVAYPTRRGITWRKGRTYTIRWSGFTGSYVKIELYSGSTLNRTITSSTSNDGAYSWSVPSGQTAGQRFKIKITSTSTSAEYDYSNNFFTIN